MLTERAVSRKRILTTATMALTDSQRMLSPTMCLRGNVSRCRRKS